MSYDGREHDRRNANGCKVSHARKVRGEMLKTGDRKTESKSQFFSQALLKIDCFLLI